MMTTDEARLERLSKTINTVAAIYHDAYAEWQIVGDAQRRTVEDCRLQVWGETLAEALEKFEKLIAAKGSQPHD